MAREMARGETLALWAVYAVAAAAGIGVARRFVFRGGPPSSSPSFPSS